MLKRLALALLTLGLSLPALGATYYVRTGGSDSANCTDSTTNACASAQRVIDLYDLAPGDIIDIGAGTFRGTVRLCNSTSGICTGSATGNNDEGSVGNPIIIRGAGAGQTFLQPTEDIADASFSATVGRTNVYQLTYGTTVHAVYETVWSNTVRVDDSAVTRVVYDFDTPISYSPVTSLAEVESVAGSFWQSGGILYVHMWDNGNPVTAGRNLEVTTNQNAFNIQGTSSNSLDYITVQDLTIRYGYSLVTLGNSSTGYADNIIFDNVELYSAYLSAFSVGTGSDNGTLSDSTIKNVQYRGSPTGTLSKNQGWIDGGNGDAVGFNICSGCSTTGWTFDNNTMANAWEVFNTYGMTNGTVSRNLIKNSPNHVFIMKHESGGGCNAIVVERNVIYNGQESIYNAGCTNITFRRNAAQLTTTDEGRSAGALTWKSNLTCYTSNNEYCIAIPNSVVAAGYMGDYNWYDTTADECVYNGTDYNTCADFGIPPTYPDSCQATSDPDCEIHSINALSVTLAGTTWPISAGLAASILTKADFYLPSGSPLINAGDPDLDGDGALETGAGGDDECTVAHHCYGGAPDIGPFEFGIDTTAVDTTAPAAVSTLSTSSPTSNSVLLTWTAPGDDGSTGTATSYDVRYTVGTTGCPELDSDTDFNNATQASGEPTPQVAGSSQSMTVSGLSPSTTYCFAIKTADEVGNTSPISSPNPTGTTSGAGAGTDISCTESAFETAIAELNAGTRTLITFNCTNTTIQLTASRHANRVVSASNALIDGENKGITFQMNPAWWDLSTTFCAGTDCDPNSDGIPTACPDTGDDGRSEWFLQINGASSGVKNLTYQYFMESVQLRAAGAYVNGVTCNRPGDDCVSNPNSANVSVLNSTFFEACDKAIQIYGDEALGGASYDVTLTGNTFTNTVQPIRHASSGGRFYIEDNIFQGSSPSQTMYTCDGPRFDSSTACASYWKDNATTGCRRGIRMGGSSQYISLGGNSFTNNTLRGLVGYGSARLLVVNDTFTTNGGGSTAGDPTTVYGGLGIGQTAVLDCGGGSQTLDGGARSSSGGNTFTNNRSSTDSTQDVMNQATGTVTCTNNCWGDADPTDQISGTVTYSPLGSCGSSSVSGTMRGVNACTACTLR